MDILYKTSPTEVSDGKYNVIHRMENWRIRAMRLHAAGDHHTVLESNSQTQTIKLKLHQSIFLY